MSKLDYIVYIGRFQPFHVGHYDVLMQAFDLAKHVIIVVGSHQKSPDIRNPFPTNIRGQLIEDSLTDDEYARVTFHYQPDHTYNEARWLTEIQSAVFKIAQQHAGGWTDKPVKPSIGIIGFTKDHTSFYLKKFPQWETIEADSNHELSSTDIRKAYWEMGETNPRWFVDDEAWGKTNSYLESATTEHGLKEEYDYIKDYKKSWDDSPYPVNHVAGDALITQAGHLLVIFRGGFPGKGQIAMPGGFLNVKETVLECVVRELREETKLKVPEPVLYGSIKSQRVFDSPDRSTRGRIISHTTHFELNDVGKLPKVVGSDDARSAWWMPISQFISLRSRTFEDHHSIVSAMMGV